MVTKLLNLLPCSKRILTLTNHTSPHGATTCDLYYNLLHHATSQFPIILFSARPLSNENIHLKTLLFIVNPTSVLITGTWCRSPTFDYLLHADNYIFLWTNRRHGIEGGTIIYVLLSSQACKSEHECLDAIDESTWVTANYGSKNYMLVKWIYRPLHADTNFDKFLTDIFFTASHQEHIFKIIGGDFNRPNITWSLTTTPGRYNKTLWMGPISPKTD